MPKARTSRCTQSTASLIAEVDGELELNPTDSGPSEAAQVIHPFGNGVQRLVPGDPLPPRVRGFLGLVRLIGWRSREGW